MSPKLQNNEDMTHTSSAAESKPRRRGPKSRLEKFQPPSESADPLSDKLLNDPQWFARYGGFMVRDSCGDETCRIDLDVDGEMVERIRKNLDALSGTAVQDHFVTYAGSVKMIPPFPREESYEVAISISQALTRTAEQLPEAVRTAVCAYAYGVRRSDKLLVLAKPEHARFGRALIDTVRSLNLKFLRWRIRGFGTDKTPQRLPKTVPIEWCKRLGIPSNTPIKWLPPKNKKNLASAGHIAVEVVEQCGKSLEVSGNFYSVMLVAKVVFFPDASEALEGEVNEKG
jgi:hypothetical protein